MILPEPQTVTIKIPADKNSKGITKTQGTQVVLADGTIIAGVTKIVLTANCNDIWRADISVNVRAESMEGIHASFLYHRTSRWQKFKRWFYARS